MSIALKDAVKIVTDAVDSINKRFPIKWEDITNKPNIDITDFYTKEEVNALLKKSHQLTSPDGSTWSPSIDDNGTLIWKKETNNGGR
ncbi:hypothetical protein [Lactiplantibacillus plantarum]|uniref:hypothetical protein n=1 Tax=Lactiplantibacillus plantarum TaxID=1590 RepID=UPI0011C85B4A|nr:hypothetical protein [Lactiplantibacillus plantarum]MCW6147738.1 hypothetical protein [Lactiplantibacillus plantarum]TXJ69106.1 hypothetical protein FGO87_04680 [Lactiplantibacillus plantarum]TXJ73177.1 hypothetical protein FGO88_05145 [Lactiplantibacillus plantarum]TXJ96511.1 hypothetical protein FFV23_03995 [Lactiplantibacillus plantarum]